MPNPLHHPRPFSTQHPSGRVAKPRREFGDPIAFPKELSNFLPPPLTNNTNLTLPLHAVMADDWIVSAGKIVFHTVGDTGGSNGTEMQEAVAGVMEDQVREAPAEGKPAFFYHLGDVVYFNGQSYSCRYRPTITPVGTGEWAFQFGSVPV